MAKIKEKQMVAITKGKWKDYIGRVEKIDPDSGIVQVSIRSVGEMSVVFLSPKALRKA